MASLFMGFGDRLDVSLSTNVADTGNALKFNIVGADLNPVGIGNRNLTITKTNWTGTKGVSLWVKNPNAGQVPVRLIFQEAGGELWLPKTDAKVALNAKDGSRMVGSVVYQTVNIPGGFEGTLDMPVDSFTDLDGTKQDGVLQLADITKVYFDLTP